MEFKKYRIDKKKASSSLDDKNKDSSSLDDKITNLERRFNVIESTLKEQNDQIITELAGIKVFVRQLCTAKRIADNVVNTFPLKVEELADFESKISSTSEGAIIQAVQNIIKKGGISKNLPSLSGSSVLF